MAPHEGASKPDYRAPISAECDAIKAMLLRKHVAYGDSAFAPDGWLCKAGAELRLRARADEKIHRLKNVEEEDQEDSILDLIGYLILIRVLKRSKA